jgi:hypothetical protein
MYRYACLILSTALLLTAAEANAQGFNEGPGPEKKISAGLLLGYGISFEDQNGWGVGLGVRGGYNLNQIYLGGRFVYHFGETYEGATGGLTIAEATINLWEVGVEAGYDLLVADKLTIRPEVGLGIATRIASADSALLGDLFSDTNTNPYLALGASGLYDITPELFLGLDARIQLILGDGSPAALVLLINGGMRF